MFRRIGNHRNFPDRWQGPYWWKSLKQTKQIPSIPRWTWTPRGDELESIPPKFCTAFGGGSHVPCKILGRGRHFEAPTFDANGVSTHAACEIGDVGIDDIQGQLVGQYSRRSQALKTELKQRFHGCPKQKVKLICFWLSEPDLDIFQIKKTHEPSRLMEVIVCDSCVKNGDQFEPLWYF